MLAQLVEQLAFNQLVTGSNPVHPTIIFQKITPLKINRKQVVILVSKIDALFCY